LQVAAASRCSQSLQLTVAATNSCCSYRSLQLSVAGAIGCCSYPLLKLSVAASIIYCSYQSLQQLVAAAIVVVVDAAVAAALFLRPEDVFSSCISWVGFST